MGLIINMRLFPTILFTLALTLSNQFLGFAANIEPYMDKIQTYSEPFSEAEIQFFSKEANLIFEGQCSALAQLSEAREVFIDARAQHGIKYNNINEMLSDLPWVVTFKIDKVLKGELAEGKDAYYLLVHSPGTTFGLDIDRDRSGSNQKYRIYVKLYPDKVQGELEENILLAAERVEEND
jgi:hypothetical protein